MNSIPLTDDFLRRVMSYYKTHTTNDIIPMWRNVLSAFTPLQRAIYADDIHEVRNILSNIYNGVMLWGIDFRYDAIEDENGYRQRTLKAIQNLANDCMMPCEEVTDEIISTLESKCGCQLNCPIYPNRPVIQIGNRSIPCRFVTSVHLLYKLRQHINQPKEVLEIGAGAGYIAYLFRIYYPQVKYHIIDLPMISVFQSCVYATMVGEDNIWFNGEPKNSDAKLYIYSPNDTHNISDKSIDFCVNHNSFPEIPQSIQIQYLNEIRRVLVDKGFFYSVNWEPEEKKDQTPTYVSCKKLSFVRSHRALFMGEDGYSYYEELYKP